MIKNILFVFQSIYNDEIGREGFDASALLSKDVARKAMQDARVKKIPPCPEDIAESIKLLKDANCPDDIAKTYLGDVSWQPRKKACDSESPKAQYGLLLGDKDLFENITSQSQFYFADGTFGCTPRQARNVSIRGSQVNLSACKYSA